MPESETQHRSVGYSHSDNFATLLEQLGVTLLVSTYQAGKLVAIGSHENQLTLNFHNFDRPMGIAMDDSGDNMAVAGREKVWFLVNDRNVAARLDRPGSYRNCFLTRSAHVTGPIQTHEMAWVNNELWVVNTLFSCLCTIGGKYSFQPRWKPPFITELAAEDRCHLNGMAIEGDRVAYVTAMAASDTAGGWRPTKASAGRIIDVSTGEDVATGFAMPHSPRVHQGELFVLDSGHGALRHIDRASGATNTIARFPGYTRGLAMTDRYAFIGLSRIRETSTFGGIPIAEDRGRLKCGVCVVELTTGKLVGQLEFTSGVEEIFDVKLIHESERSAIRGPYSTEDGEAPLWVVPSI